MEDTHENKTPDGPGTAFMDIQNALDKAKNERIKDETGSDKLAPEDANNPDSRNHKTSVSRKKTGGGKQSSPGD